MKHHNFKEAGMILIMVVLITSAILAVGLGIFAGVFNQLRSAGETRFSFNALYAADHGLERTLYLDRVAGPLCPGAVADGAGDIDCYALADFPIGNNACATVRVSKDIKCDETEEAGWTRIRATGLYPCGSGELGVKRAFCLQYQPAAGSSASFQESGGLVQGETEDFDQNVAQGGHDWTASTVVAGFSGAGYMEATPDSGVNNQPPPDYVANSPYMTYSINFTTTGTYYAWVRMNSPNGAADSLHAGLNGAATASADRMYNSGPSNKWTWTNDKIGGLRATVYIPSAGMYELFLWMREDGNRIDQWLLTTDGGFTPF